MNPITVDEMRGLIADAVNRGLRHWFIDNHEIPEYGYYRRIQYSGEDNSIVHVFFYTEQRWGRGDKNIAIEFRRGFSKNSVQGFGDSFPEVSAR